MLGVRAVLPAAALVVLLLSGCMSPHAWDSYDSGRGLAFSTILGVLLLAGLAVLVANLATRSSPDQPVPPMPPAPQDPVPSAGWEPVAEPEPTDEPDPAPAAAKRKPARKAASKSSKPRRPSA